MTEETGETHRGQIMKYLAGHVKQFVLRALGNQNSPGYFKFVPYLVIRNGRERW